MSERDSYNDRRPGETESEWKTRQWRRLNAIVQTPTRYRAAPKEGIGKRAVKSLKQKLFGTPPVKEPNYDSWRRVVAGMSQDRERERLAEIEARKLADQRAAAAAALKRSSVPSRPTTVYESPKPAPTPVKAPSNPVQEAQKRTESVRNTAAPEQPSPKRTGEKPPDPELVDQMMMLKGRVLMTQARNRGDFEEAERIRRIVGDHLESRQREKEEAMAKGSTPPLAGDGHPNLPKSLQVDSSLSPGQDIYPPEYYRGNRGSGPVLPPSLQTRPSPGDIHPPGYHTGGQGRYMPPQFRTGPGGPFGR